jgi:hypothetical protein
MGSPHPAWLFIQVSPYACYPASHQPCHFPCCFKVIDLRHKLRAYEDEILNEVSNIFEFIAASVFKVGK